MKEFRVTVFLFVLVKGEAVEATRLCTPARQSRQIGYNATDPDQGPSSPKVVLKLREKYVLDIKNERVQSDSFSFSSD